jgi:hypothetical protein
LFNLQFDGIFAFLDAELVGRDSVSLLDFLAVSIEFLFGVGLGVFVPVLVIVVFVFFFLFRLRWRGWRLGGCF